MNRHRQTGAMLLILILFLYCLPVQAMEQTSFAQVFERIRLPMLLIEPSEGRIVDANPAAASYYGYPRETLVTMRINEINTFTPEQVRAEWQRAQREQRNYFIFRHRLASGEVRTVDVYSQPFFFNGRERLLSIIVDIGEGRLDAGERSLYEKRLEEQVDAQLAQIRTARTRTYWLLGIVLLLQAAAISYLVFNLRRQRALRAEQARLVDELNQRNAELARLAEVMAHHFQEPARRLVSFSQRLKRQEKLIENEDGRRALGFIEEQAARLSRLVLDIQRYLAVNVSPADARAHCEARAVMEAQLAGHKGRLEEAGAQISLPEGPLWVGVSASDFAQMFAIVLDNALAYRAAGRALILRIGARRSGQRLHFYFIDNGNGIPEEYRERARELFVRLAPPQSDAHGTGMGLALLDRHVRRLGGRLALSDGMDGGLCVEFDLPTGEAS